MLRRGPLAPSPHLVKEQCLLFGFGDGEPNRSGTLLRCEINRFFFIYFGGGSNVVRGPERVDGGRL